MKSPNKSEHRVTVTFLLSLVMLCSCSEEPSARYSDEIAQDVGSSRLQSWPEVQDCDTLSDPGILSLVQTGCIKAPELNSSRPRGYITADSLGFVVTGIWTSYGIETRAYDWDCTQNWVNLDSVCAGGMPPTLGAISIHDNRVYITGVSHRLLVLNRENGEYIEEITLPGVQELDNGAPFLHGTSMCVTDSMITIGWFSWVPAFTGFCASIYDSSNRELFNLGNHPANFQGKSSECRVSCGNNDVYFASVAEDKIYKYASNGDLIDCFTSGYTPVRDLESSSIRGEPVLFPVIASIHFEPPGTLWVLYGDGAFNSDSSEIRRVDIFDGSSFRAGLAGSAIGFGVCETEMALVFRGTDADSVTREWSGDENYIWIGTWKIED